MKMEFVERNIEQPWYESRRLWAAALTLVATAAIGFAPEQYELIVQAGMLIAMGLGIRSWVAPIK